MREIKKCYRKLEKGVDIVENYDFFASNQHGSAIYKEKNSIHIDEICRIGKGYIRDTVWDIHFFRRIK